MWRRRARSSPTLHNRRTDSYWWISKGDLYSREVRQPSATVGEHPDSMGLLSLSTPPESSYYTSCPTSASTVSRLRVFQVGSPMVRLVSLLHCDTTRLRRAPEVSSAPCTLPASFARCCLFLELRRLRSFAPSPTRESRDEDHPGEGRERDLSRHRGSGRLGRDFRRTSLVVATHPVQERDGPRIPVNADVLFATDAAGRNPCPEHGRDAVLSRHDGAVAQRPAHVRDDRGGHGEE